MNLKSWNFIGSLRNKPKRPFAVIGLGRFGRSVCQTLHELKYEVLAIDSDEKRVAQISSENIVDQAQTLDSTDAKALQQAGIFEFETVIVAIGNFVEESIITTLNLKEGGVKEVVAKASSEIHEKLLRKVGADKVIFPEHDAGRNLARSLTKPAILDKLEIDPNHSIVEISVPDEFQNNTIAELDLRAKYGFNIIGLYHKGDFSVNPPPNQSVTMGSIMVVLGSNDSINRFLSTEST